MHKRGIRVGGAAALAVVVWCLPAAAVRQDIPGPILARVVEVIDGDTILVEARIWLDQVVTTRVRLAGVDAPEMNGACDLERAAARAARAFLGGRIAADPDGARVVLHRVRWGKYAGRVLAQVSTPDGADLAAALVAAGHARPYAGGRRPAWCR